MFRTLLKKILSWLREVWNLLKVIDEAIPAYHSNLPTKNTRQQLPQSTHPTHERKNVLQIWESKSNSPLPIRHRYIELDGYSDRFRIDNKGRYDLNQIAKFTENFVWIGPNDIQEFINDGIKHTVDYIDGVSVLWVDKDECIEWAYHQYSAIADLL
jgi:hypothetical protein